MKALFVGLLLLVLLLARPVVAQTALLHTVAAPTFGNQLRILPTADGGWVLFAMDSLKLARFSSCGRPVWGYRYRPTGLALTPWPAEIIRLRQGGFAFATRALVGGVAQTLLTRLDDAGQVQWSLTLDSPDYNQYPYTLSEDPQGNVVLFGNLEHANLTPMYNLICQVSPAGILRWARAYGLGGIWGGAIVTADSGVLARTGSRFIRTDAAGQVQWVSQVNIPGDNSYYAPHEVGDGFIFNSYGGSGREINFYKLDLQGRLRWNGGKRTPFVGAPPLLRARPNGHFAGVFNRPVNSRNYPTVVEFDADLTPVRQNALAPADLPLFGTDLHLTTAGAVLLTGWAGNAPGLFFFARTDSLGRFACDSTLAPPAFTHIPATQEFITITATDFPLTITARTITRASAPLASSPVCASPQTLDLGPDTTVCPGTTLTLRSRGAAAFEHYRWSTGATAPALTVRQGGTYWVRAYYNCGFDSLTDTVRVRIATLPSPAPATDTLLCANATVTLDARVAGPAAYRWQDGSSAPLFVATDTGSYFVDISQATCTQRFYFRVSECEQLLMPNIFTATGDALNERLLPIIIRGIGAASLEIYNRWGRRIYATADLRHEGWDGAGAGPGTYFWLVRYTTARGQLRTAKGWVELLRD